MQENCIARLGRQSLLLALIGLRGHVGRADATENAAYDTPAPSRTTSYATILHALVGNLERHGAGGKGDYVLEYLILRHLRFFQLRDLSDMLSACAALHTRFALSRSTSVHKSSRRTNCTRGTSRGGLSTSMSRSLYCNRRTRIVQCGYPFFCMLLNSQAFWWR